MKGLRKYLTPFAPDQSGAVSVLYELGGLLVICDAGGCAGNVCGFDEPRWFSRKSAIFSAGLRDMDAILGRDDRLAAKLADAAKKLDVSFAAIIGTPVPAVIGTDYRALGRMVEKRTELPVLTIDTNGMDLYDKGQEKAWLALFQKFAVETLPAETGCVGILGATPQDLSDLSAGEKLKHLLGEQNGKRGVCYGMGDGLEAVRRASAAQYNLVVSPSALAAAKYLKKQFGTPYIVDYPPAQTLLPACDFQGKRVLINHQQVIGNALRKEVLKRGAAEAALCSWFSMQPELSEEGDLHLKEEEDFLAAAKGPWDVIIADPAIARMIPEFKGTFIGVNHFAVSGKLA